VAAAHQRYVGGSVSGGVGGAQRNDGSALAAAQQRDIGSSLAAARQQWQRQRRWQ
jgi:hypothetical protein